MGWLSVGWLDWGGGAGELGNVLVGRRAGECVDDWIDAWMGWLVRFWVGWVGVLVGWLVGWIGWLVCWWVYVGRLEGG